MTKDRVRQLAELAASIYFRRDTELTLPDIMERLVLAALDENLEPDLTLIGLVCYHTGVTSNKASELIRAMSAVRRAALQSSKPEG